MIHVGWPGPLWVVTPPGQVILGCVREQAEPVQAWSKPVNITPWFCFCSCLQVPASFPIVTSFSDGVWPWNKSLFPQLLLGHGVYINCGNQTRRENDQESKTLTMTDLCCFSENCARVLNLRLEEPLGAYAEVSANKPFWWFCSMFYHCTVETKEKRIKRSCFYRRNVSANMWQITLHCSRVLTAPLGEGVEKAQQQGHKTLGVWWKVNSRLLYLAMGRTLYTLPAPRHSNVLTLGSRPLIVAAQSGPLTSQADSSLSFVGLPTPPS